MFIDYSKAQSPENKPSENKCNDCSHQSPSETQYKDDICYYVYQKRSSDDYDPLFHFSKSCQDAVINTCQHIEDQEWSDIHE